MGPALAVVGFLVLLAAVVFGIRWTIGKTRKQATGNLGKSSLALLGGALALMIVGGALTPTTPTTNMAAAADASSRNPSRSASSSATSPRPTASATTSAIPSSSPASGSPSAATASASAAAGPAAAATRARPYVIAGMAMPDPRLTAGETFAGVTAGQVCTSGWSAAHRNVTMSVRYQVFTSYGIPYANHSSYEVDHLISLELGGDNSIQNLWPEPQTQNDKNGPDKDALENHLHALVCSGRVSLATAERAIATNWVTAWNTYEGMPAGSSSVSGSTTVAHRPAAKPTWTPSPSPVATKPPTSSNQGVVHPGSFCAPAGARGHTSKGTSMVCGPASDGRNRWHSG